MLIFGHKFIESAKFIQIVSKDDIKKTTPNDIVVLNGITEPFELAKYCQENSISYAIKVSSIKDAIFSNALGASYAICNFELAKELQKIATEYLWDMKILAVINSDKMLEKVALSSIDGIIYENFLKGGENGN